MLPPDQRPPSTDDVDVLDAIVAIDASGLDDGVHDDVDDGVIDLTADEPTVDGRTRGALIRDDVTDDGPSSQEVAGAVDVESAVTGAVAVAGEVAVTGEPARIVRGPVVDPRIRARRIAVAREQGRRRLRVVLVFLSIVVLAGTAWLVVRSPMLDVDHVVVTGLPKARVAAVVAAADVHRHDPLLLVSTGAVARRVEQVPGVGSVHVSREYPGTLHISALEQGVALWVRTTGGVALIGYDGRVQRVAPVVPQHVIELRALVHVPAPGGRIADPGVVNVRSQLPTALRLRVGAISAVTPNDVRLYLVTGGEVRLGDVSSLPDKGAAAEAVIEHMGCTLTYVDVRSISNPVARPAAGATCTP